MNTGTIIAIAVGAVVVLLLIAVAARAASRRRDERRRRLMSRPPKPSVLRLKLRNAPLRRGRDMPPLSDGRLRLSI